MNDAPAAGGATAGSAGLGSGPGPGLGAGPFIIRLSGMLARKHLQGVLRSSKGAFKWRSRFTKRAVSEFRVYGHSSCGIVEPSDSPPGHTCLNVRAIS